MARNKRKKIKKSSILLGTGYQLSPQIKEKWTGWKKLKLCYQ